MWQKRPKQQALPLNKLPFIDFHLPKIYFLFNFEMFWQTHPSLPLVSETGSNSQMTYSTQELTEIRGNDQALLSFPSLTFTSPKFCVQIFSLWNAPLPSLLPAWTNSLKIKGNDHALFSFPSSDFHFRIFLFNSVWKFQHTKTPLPYLNLPPPERQIT